VTATGHVEGVCRVLALRANGIGDFLMVLPALGAVRRTYPDAELTVVGDTWLSDLVEHRPGPWDRFLLAPAFPGLRGLPPDAVPGPDVEGFVQEQQRHGYDIALQLHGGGGTSNRLVAQLGARVTAGARAADAPALDRSVPYLPHRHEVLRWLEVTALVGAAHDLGVEDLVPRLAVTPRDLEQSRTALPDAERFVALHVGARDLRRRWPADRFVDLSRRLMAAGLDVVLVGGPSDRRTAAGVADQLDAAAGRCHDLTGRLTLGGTLGTLSQAAVFVGNDSGPRHLATAVGTPTVATYWVGNVMAFGPLVGGRDRVLVSFQVDCPVCGVAQLERRCAHDVSFVEPVTVDQVHAEVIDVLAEQPA
jgi:ADP-heptose:LPS heptosyltransferase